MAKELATKTKHAKSKKRLILTFVTILAIFCVIFSLGKYITPPWELSIVANNITGEKAKDNLIVFADESGNRLTFADKNKNILDVKSAYTTDNNLFFFGDVEISSDSLFVKEYCYHKGSQFIKEEKIAKYNLDGTKVGDLVSYSYDLDNNYASTTRTGNYSLSSDKLYYTYLDVLNNTYSINSINLSTNEVIQEDALMQSFPSPFSITAVHSIYYNSSQNILQVADSFGNTYCALPEEAHFAKAETNFVNDINQKGKYSTTSSLSPFSSDRTIINGEECYFGIVLMLRILCFWAGLLFLAVFLVVLAVKKIKKSNKAALLNKIKVPAIICLLALIVLGTIVYINNYNKDEEIKEFNQVLTQNVLLMKENTQEKLVGLIKTDINSADYVQKVQGVNSILQNNSLISARNDISSNYAIFRYADNTLELIVNSTDPFVSGLDIADYLNQISIASENDVILGNVSGVLGNFQYASTNITDSSNTVIGTIFCSRNIDTGNSVINNATLMLMMGIASALIALSFLIMEGIAWVKSFSLRRKRNKQNKMAKELSLTRPLYCLNTAAGAADATIGVLIFQQMLVGTPFEGNTMMVSLPMTCSVLGYLIGILVFGTVIRKLGVKPTILLSALGTCICFIVCAYTVATSKIFLLSAALLCANFFKQFCSMYLKDVSIHIDNKAQREEFNNNCSASAICGIALMTIVTGYVSDAIGDWCVYLVAIIPVAIMIVMILTMLPKLCALDKSNANRKETKQKSNAKEIVRFIFRDDMLILILSVYVIWILISGYKTFIFPLAAGMNGVSNSDVSNISVFANALVFYITPLFTSVQKRFGNVSIMISAMLITGVMFLMFMFNSTFLWACCVYLIVQFISKLLWPSSTGYWQNIALQSNTDSSVALSATTMADKVLNLSKNSIMGALMGVGTIFACIVIGAYSMVAAGVFAIVSRKNTDSKEKDT